MSDSSSQSPLSRRGFLRGSMAASAGAALASPAGAQTADDLRAALDKPGARPAEAATVRCAVNGAARELPAGPDTSALEVIRQRLGLTGTKAGCGHGACGACTVLVDGSPQVSCLLPAVALHGAEVTTVEGLATGPKAADLHPVQRAFAAEDALQCGFCTPGFVVEAAAFVDQWRAANGDGTPDRDTVADALSGHLCRCGAYENIFAAVQAACAGRYDGAGVAAERVDALDKVTGRARYTVDVQVPGMLVGRVLRAPLAHGVVRTLDLRPALKIGGVKAAVAFTEPGKKVRFAGQELAAVAGVSAEAVAEGLAAIQIEIDALPHVLDLDAARRPDAPVLYPKGDREIPSAAESPVFGAKWDGNTRGPVSSAFLSKKRAAQKKLDALAATEPADSPRFVRKTWRAHSQAHTALEPHAAVARFNSDGTVDLWASTQSVAYLAEDVADRFKLRRDRVRVHAPFVGGGFGAKVGLQIEALAALQLSREAGAPVSVVWDRAEELQAGGVRPAHALTVSAGVGPQGELDVLGMESFGDSGVAVGTLLGFLGRLIYPTPYKHLVDSDVVTNTAPGRPFRGPGGPAALFGLESTIDELALRRNLDPVQLRKRWDPNPARQRLYRWAEGLRAWTERPAVGSQTGRTRRGVGLAIGTWPAFVEPGTRVELSASADGFVARTASQDIGTGSRSVIAHAIARILDVSPHRIRVELGESDTVHGPMSAGSRTTASVGPAAEDAAQVLIAELVRQAEDGLYPDGVTPEPGGVRHAGGFQSWLELLQQLPAVTVIGRRIRDEGGYFSPISFAGMNISKGLPGCVVIADVDVDTRLGRVAVNRVHIGMGAGRIYVPRLAENQVQGGVLQGISYALYEEQAHDPQTGRLLTRNLEDYRLAGPGDCPPIDVFFDEEGFEHVTGGGVGIGELCTVAVPAAIANAVHAATRWRPDALPLSPQRVLAGLQGVSA